MGFVADEQPADAPQPTGRFVPDERRAAPPAADSFLKKYAPGYLGPLGAMRMMSEGVHPMQLLEKGANKVGETVNDLYAKVLPPEAAAVFGAGANVAVNAIPALFSGGAAAAASPAVENMATSLMTKALRPSLEKVRSGKAATAIQTMLDEGINVTSGGVAKMKGAITGLNDEIMKLVSGSKVPIDKQAVLEPMLKDYGKIMAQPTNTAEDLAKLSSMARDFLDHPVLAGSSTMSPEIAQTMKQAAYRQLGDAAYATGAKPMVERDALRSIASGLRTEIGKAVPEVMPLNARESALITARDMAEKRVIQDSTKGMSLGWLAHNPKAALAYMLGNNPAAQSVLANTLHANSGSLPMGGAAVGAGSLEALLAEIQRRAPQQ